MALPGGRIGIPIFVWARALNLKSFRILAGKSRRFEFGALPVDSYPAIDRIGAITAPT